MEGSGNGNSVITVTSGSNEGTDIREVFRISVSDKLFVDVSVVHLGRREPLTLSDGLFLLRDSTTFNVLKDEQ